MIVQVQQAYEAFSKGSWILPFSFFLVLISIWVFLMEIPTTAFVTPWERRNPPHRYFVHKTSCMFCSSCNLSNMLDRSTGVCLLRHQEQWRNGDAEENKSNDHQETKSCTVVWLWKWIAIQKICVMQFLIYLMLVVLSRGWCDGCWSSYCWSLPTNQEVLECVCRLNVFQFKI